ncbi:MAG TPA: ABC transporter ATP-binding protein [Microbacteriaceae bacterium]
MTRTRTSTTEDANGDLETRADAHRGHKVVVRNVHKRYGSVEVLRGVDIDIEPGKFMVLLGPSGSGKTTLLRGLAGIERFDSGTVAFGDREISTDHRQVPAERRDLAMVFQDYALWPHLTVQQNVAYALRRRHIDASVARSRVLETLDRVGLVAKSASYPNELSGGQQQRVALARAIVGRPALLLFDEPLSNLDADLRERLRVEISTLTRASGATALYITHDQSEAFALADEIGVLHNGVLEQRGTPEEIFRQPATPFVARFTGLAGTFSGIAQGNSVGYVHVRIGDRIIFATCGAPIAAGTAVDVLIRPTATQLVELRDERRGARPDARPDATGQPTAASEPIVGTIVDVAYRGRGYDHVVDCGYGQLTSVFDIRARARGSRCLISIAPAGCMAFPVAEPMKSTQSAQ